MLKLLNEHAPCSSTFMSWQPPAIKQLRAKSTKKAVQTQLEKYLLYHVNYLRHVTRHTRLKRRGQAMKIHHIHMKFFTISPAQTNRIFIQFICSSNYLHNTNENWASDCSYIMNNTRYNDLIIESFLEKKNPHREENQCPIDEIRYRFNWIT